MTAATLAAVFSALGGCVTLYEGDCARFEQAHRQRDDKTHYHYEARATGARLLELPPLPAGRRAAAPLYTLALDRRETRPCSHLVMKKTLFLHRTAGQDLVFVEVREFYAADSGVRITENSENLTEQFRTSGYYTAEVPLPIPAQAPPGRYRIVSKLLLRQGRRQHVLLAEASAEFRVREADRR